MISCCSTQAYPSCPLCLPAFLLVLREIPYPFSRPFNDRSLPKSIQGYPLQLHSRHLKSPSAPFTTRTPQLCLHTPEQCCITLNIEVFL
ncbi:hypothetical protein XENOCAPTIV_017816, partial [Xenoophorus captivus]